MDIKKVIMDKKTQAYLDFLRFSINENTEVPSSAKNIDWEGLLQFGTKQCVRGVLFLGMKKLGTAWAVVGIGISHQEGERAGLP